MLSLERIFAKIKICEWGHTTKIPSSITYSSMVSRDPVRIALTLAGLNDLDILAYSIQNVYLLAKCREKIYTIAGPQFCHRQM